jgi:hypothetical protein
LEEPPPDTIIFLTTPSKNFLPPTIVSRCALHHLPPNSQTELAPYFAPWLQQFQLFLQKLPLTAETINVPEILSSVNRLSEDIENLENLKQKNNNSTDSEIIGDIQQRLFGAMGKKIWEVFGQKISPHTTEQFLSIMDQSSSMMEVNDSLIHGVEYILLHLSLMRFDRLDRKRIH